MNQKVVKSKASAVVDSLTRAARPSESGQGDGATLAEGEKENLIPPMLLAWSSAKSSVNVDLDDLMTTSPREPTGPE